MCVVKQHINATHNIIAQLQPGRQEPPPYGEFPADEELRQWGADLQAPRWIG